MRLLRNLRPDRRVLSTNEIADEIRAINRARARAAADEAGSLHCTCNDDYDREAVSVATVAADIVARIGGAK